VGVAAGAADAGFAAVVCMRFAEVPAGIASIEPIATHAAV
jgi:hypothetical protein